MQTPKRDQDVGSIDGGQDGFSGKGGGEPPHSMLVAEEVGLEDEVEDAVGEEAEVDGAESG
jgi:hypothetical protein